eukprot:Skav203732  [mRNA]  locus=scaffold68:42450:42815:+ [translate_table: standard]
MGSGASSSKVVPELSDLSALKDADAKLAAVAPSVPMKFSSFGPHEFVVDLPEGVNLPPCKDDHDHHVRNLVGYLRKIRRSPRKLVDKVQRKRSSDELRSEEEEKRMVWTETTETRDASEPH